jgi:O-antigen ligase
VGASVVGCIYALACINKNHLSRTFKVFFIIVAITAVTFPIWGGVTDMIMQKQENNIEMGGTFASREEKYAARIREYESSPLIGIGYCTVNPQLDNVNRENGQIEPGSSWLAIASMTGIIGLLVMIPLCISSLKKARRIKDDFWRGTLSGMMIFFILHMTVEGYIFAPKSYLSLIFWLLISIIDGKTCYERNYRVV